MKKIINLKGLNIKDNGLNGDGFRERSPIGKQAKQFPRRPAYTNMPYYDESKVFRFAKKAHVKAECRPDVLPATTNTTAQHQQSSTSTRYFCYYHLSTSLLKFIYFFGFYFLLYLLTIYVIILSPYPGPHWKNKKTFW